MPPAHGNCTIRRIAGLTLACFAIACDSTQQPSADTAAVAAPSTAPAATPGEDWLNAMDGQKLFDALNDKARWTKSKDSPKERRCVDPAKCGMTGRVGVNLWVEKNANNVGDAIAGDTAILVGKLSHVGGAGGVGESRMYRVRPGRYVYALFIMTGDDTSGVYQIRELDTSNKQHTVHASGVWLRCDHPRSATSAEAEFRACKPPHLPDSLNAALDHEDPAWFTCTAGCCTAGSSL